MRSVSAWPGKFPPLFQEDGLALTGAFCFCGIPLGSFNWPLRSRVLRKRSAIAKDPKKFFLLRRHRQLFELITPPHKIIQASLHLLETLKPTMKATSMTSTGIWQLASKFFQEFIWRPCHFLSTLWNWFGRPSLGLGFGFQLHRPNAKSQWFIAGFSLCWTHSFLNPISFTIVKLILSAYNIQNVICWQWMHVHQQMHFQLALSRKIFSHLQALPIFSSAAALQPKSFGTNLGKTHFLPGLVPGFGSACEHLHCTNQAQLFQFLGGPVAEANAKNQWMNEGSWQRKEACLRLRKCHAPVVSCLSSIS